jgi:hypothetical protein
MRWIMQALPEWKELNVEAVDVTCEESAKKSGWKLFGRGEQCRSRVLRFGLS